MILGHSSPAVIRQVYAHVMKRATADQVGTATELLACHRRGQSVGNPVNGKDSEPEITTPR
ncbi:MAG: hypothetical protein ACRCYU_01520 [Nocardioides sp.]